MVFVTVCTYCNTNELIKFSGLMYRVFFKPSVEFNDVIGIVVVNFGFLFLAGYRGRRMSPRYLIIFYDDKLGLVHLRLNTSVPNQRYCSR